MTVVEIPVETAKELLRGLRYAELIPALSKAYADLGRAVEIAQEADEFATLLPPVQRERTTPRPQWENVAKATRLIAQAMRDDASLRSRADDLGAYVRDTWDALGLSLYDEDTLYVAVATATMMVELSNNGRVNGVTDEAFVGAVAAIAQCFTAAIIDYLPPEGR